MSTKLSPKLSSLQKRAIEGLLACGTVTAAADYAPCSRNSLYRWLKNDAFTTELAQREAVIIGEATRKLTQIAGDAIDVLSEAMVGEDASPATRVKAASCVLTHLMKIRELDSVERRLAMLEESLYESN